MMTFKIAFRNIFRNVRRSVMTILAVAVGAVAILVFGQFMGFINRGLLTINIEQAGHLTIYRKGFFDFGSGNPGAYSIDNYENMIEKINNDAILKPFLRVVTPQVVAFGIAGNFEADTSKSFFGVGVVPVDHKKMLTWDEYHLIKKPRRDLSGLSDSDPTLAVVGKSMTRILGICQDLGVSPCPPRPQTEKIDPNEVSKSAGLMKLAEEETKSNVTSDQKAFPKLDLLGATASGAPNIISIQVAAAENEGVKELDESFIGLNLKIAQQLLYGRTTPKVTSIVVQLEHTEDLPDARKELQSLIAGQDYEIKDFIEVRPMYKQIIAMFASIFIFIAVIMAVIVLFTIVNTMSMSVMERINEIGTIRALGIRSVGVLKQFIVEGFLLGSIGATLGLILAVIAAEVVNGAGLHWLPPTEAEPTPLLLLTSGIIVLQSSVWLGLVLISTIASAIPAYRASKMLIVDALRHV